MVDHIGLRDFDSRAATDGLRRLAKGETGSAETVAWVGACAKSGLCVTACPERSSGLDAMLLVRIAKQHALNETHQLVGQARPNLFPAHQDLCTPAAHRRGACQMAVSDDRVTFWFGCNMLRHAEMIRLSIMLLERVGYDVKRGRRSGLLLRDDPRSRTPSREQYGGSHRRNGSTRARQGTGAIKSITWCPSCHMHMSDIMAPGNATHFDIAHLSEILSDRAARLTSAMNVPVKRRVLLHRHVGFATHVDDQQSRRRRAVSNFGARTHRRACPSRPHVQLACRGSRRACRRRSRYLERCRREPLRHCLHDLSFLPSRIGRAGWQGEHSYPQLGASRR